MFFKVVKALNRSFHVLLKTFSVFIVNCSKRLRLIGPTTFKISLQKVRIMQLSPRLNVIYKYTW